MRNKIILIICLFLSSAAYAQRTFEEGEKPELKDRIYFGGSFAATFGTVTSVYISPVVGYMITPGLSGGIGITYQYYKDNRYSTSYNSNSYGGRLFLRQNINIIKLPLFVYGEYETLNMEGPNYDPINDDYYYSRDWYPRVLLGGGLFQPMGKRGGFYIAVLYDVIHSGNSTTNPSPYGSAWVYRIGFSF